MPTPKKKTSLVRKPKGNAAPPPDPMDTEVGGDELPNRQTRRLSTENRKTAELLDIVSRDPGTPRYPFPVGLPEEHRKYWVEIVNSKPIDYFNDGDIPLLKLYCRVAYDIERHDAMLQTEGEVIYNTKGNLVVNPRVLVRSIAETRLLSLSTKLRAQPAARINSENDKKASEKQKGARRAVEAMSGSIDADDGEPLLAGGRRTLN